MSLNIKNEAVHALVREAARRTGRSQTSVVEAALRDYLDNLSRSSQHRDRDIDEAVAGLQRAVRRSGGVPIDQNDLYDPITGLPT